MDGLDVPLEAGVAVSLVEPVSAGVEGVSVLLLGRLVREYEGTYPLHVGIIVSEGLSSPNNDGEAD